MNARLAALLADAERGQVVRPPRIPGPWRGPVAELLEELGTVSGCWTPCTCGVANPYECECDQQSLAWPVVADLRRLVTARARRRDVMQRRPGVLCEVSHV